MSSSNSYRFVWTDAAINRDANNLVTASIELFRNGGVCVTTNGVAVHLPRELSSEINDEQFKMTRPLNRKQCECGIISA